MCLSSMRGIQHCIEIVPGAVIPHKAAYRMSPKEHEELQRQVIELMQKGLVREILVLCSSSTSCYKERWIMANVHRQSCCQSGHY